MTAADLVAHAYQNDLLVPELDRAIRGVDDMRLLAVELVKALNGTCEPESDPEESHRLFANQTVSGTSAILMLVMGWLGD